MFPATKTEIKATLNKKDSYQHLLKIIVPMSRHFLLFVLIRAFLTDSMNENHKRFHGLAQPHTLCSHVFEVQRILGPPQVNGDHAQK